MNKKNYRRICLLLLLFGMVSTATRTTYGYAQSKRTSTDEEFFIVASIDLPKSQILLKHPTEVTTLLNITDKTQVMDVNRKSIRPSDLHTGDTVWVVSSGAGQAATAIRIRRGPMMAADLHRLYLDYPEIK